MARQYYVRTVEIDTDEETMDGPFPTELAAVSFAESRAEDFYGGDDVTWCQGGPLNGYLVGRVLEGGEHSDPLVTITVEEEDVEVEEDPTI